MFNKISNKLGENILTILIVLNLISFISISTFNLYDSMFFFINFFALIIVVIIQNKFNFKDIELIMYLLLFLSYTLSTLFLTDGKIGSVITPLYGILVYYVIKRTDISKKNLKFITIVTIMLNLYWIIKSPSYYDKYFFNRIDYLNSNTVGIVIMFTAIYSNILSQKVFKDRRFINVIAIIRIVLSGWAILNCQARGAFVSLIVFVFLDKVMPKAIWRNRRITMLVVSSIVFVGIAFTYIYSQMYLKGVNFTLPFSQKPIFTGREIIWLNFYGQMLKNKTALFFGLGSSADLWEGNRLNLHNSYLTILTNFGIVGFFMFYGFWIYQIKSLIKKYVLSNLQIKLLLGFTIVLILGYIEVSILWHNMFFLNYLFLGLAFEDRSSNNSFTNNY